MIVDMHNHLWREDMPSRSWWDSFVKVSASLSGKSEEKIRERLPGWMDGTGDILVSDMNDAGIDKAVILPIDYILGGGVGEVASLEAQHEVYAKAAQKYADRLIPFAGVDPRRPEAPKFLERAVKEWNVRGLKLHPCVGYYPNEPCCYRVYEKCLELGLVVLVHTGPEVYPWYSKYAQPIFLDEVANDFPELPIIMAHAGECWWEEAAMIASNKLKLFVDISWWQTVYLNFTEREFYQRLRNLMNIAGSSRVFFGSDWPAMRQVRRLNHAAWTAVIKEAPQRAEKFGINFSEEEIKKVMGGNAVKLLRL
jgi:uncharacterized protein